MSRSVPVEVYNNFQRMKKNLEAYSQKITELEGERDEHDLVINSMEDMDDSRRCFRLIGGVLVERNVGQVGPAISENKERIIASIQALKEQYKQEEQVLMKYAKENNLLQEASTNEGEQKADPEITDEQKKGVLL
eukprot:TRINITY_DN5214_c0_g2_i1.p1 TRINITY_DN5214_c0_g2~~TRINITY_DN5214_c0_g2_i1.p1  ORF type:complete len:135 (+),score=37.50 TRINITY_DN5214_c0_g2_i1:19-423(+)